MVDWKAKDTLDVVEQRETSDLLVLLSAPITALLVVDAAGELDLLVAGHRRPVEILVVDRRDAVRVHPGGALVRGRKQEFGLP